MYSNSKDEIINTHIYTVYMYRNLIIQNSKKKTFK